MLGFWAVSQLPLSTEATQALVVFPGTGSLTLTGQAPRSQFGFGPGAGSLTLTGFSFFASRSDSAQPPTGTLAFSSGSPTVAPAIAVGMGNPGFAAAYIYTGYAPRLRFGNVPVARTPLETINVMPFQNQTQGATWKDVNSFYKADTKPLILTDVRAINNSIRNLFACPKGSRSRIMQPTYGTFIYPLLQEPLDNITANKLRASLIQSLEVWEPRIQIDQTNTFVRTYMSIAGYFVQVKYIYLATKQPITYTFTVKA